MEAQDKLDEVAAYVESARTLPMSSSIVVNKSELMRLLDDLRSLLPEDLIAAQAVLARRHEMLADATSSAERLLEAAEEERQRLVSDQEVLRAARIEAGQVLEKAEERADAVRRDVDDYVDAKLAHLELSVAQILDTVRQGRERLAQPGPYPALYGALAADDGRPSELEAPDSPATPEVEPFHDEPREHSIG